MTAVLSLDVYQQHRADAAYQAQVHTAVDVLLDEWEAQMADYSAGLPSLFTRTEAVRAEEVAERHDCTSVCGTDQ